MKTKLLQRLAAGAAALAILCAAALPARAAYEAFLKELSAQGLAEVQHGEFGADMQVSLVNDGPVTIVMDTDEWK